MTEIQTQIIYKDEIENRLDFIRAKTIADELILFMNRKEIQTSLAETHQLYANSGQIQEIILPKAKELGFSSEKKGLFSDYPVKQLRPDYYLNLGSGKGIIMEVERGKTIHNNMDLLDLWKCHICSNANFLFLIIPQFRQTEKGQNTIFDTVERRMDTFFNSKNYTNVDAVFLFGY
jgi:hypothetical protein